MGLAGALFHAAFGPSFLVPKVSMLHFRLGEAPQSKDCGASLGSGALRFALVCAVWCYEHHCECDEVECSYDACD